MRCTSYYGVLYSLASARTIVRAIFEETKLCGRTPTSPAIEFTPARCIPGLRSGRKPLARELEFTVCGVCNSVSRNIPPVPWRNAHGLLRKT